MRRFRFKKPIPFDVVYDGETWSLENEELGLYGCGKSFEEAKRDFETVLEALVEGYVFEDDKNLSEKALDLKKKILEFVEVEL